MLLQQSLYHSDFLPHVFLWHCFDCVFYLSKLSYFVPFVIVLNQVRYLSFISVIWTNEWKQAVSHRTKMRVKDDRRCAQCAHKYGECLNYFKNYTKKCIAMNLLGFGYLLHHFYHMLTQFWKCFLHECF